MSEVLGRWNRLSDREAAQEILDCCGSTAWARELAAHRPLMDEASLLAASDKIWNRLPAADWLDAFSKHPRIGERIMRNMAQLLADRLIVANTKVDLLSAT